MVQPDKDWINGKLELLSQHGNELYEEDPDTVNGFGPWTALKMIAFIYTIDVYTSVISNTGWTEDWIFIDALAGSGTVEIEGTDTRIAGSPIIAAALAHEPFSKYYLIDKDGDRVEALRDRLDYAVDNIPAIENDKDDFVVLHGDSNDLLPKIQKRVIDWRGTLEGLHHLAYIDNQKAEVYYHSLEKLEKMSGDLLINHQTQQISRAHGRGEWSDLVPYYGTLNIRDVQDQEEQLRLYREQIAKLGNDGREKQAKVKIQNWSSNGTHYDLLFATRKTGGDSPYIEAFETLREKVEPLSGNEIEQVLHQIEGKSTGLDLFGSDSTDWSDSGLTQYGSIQTPDGVAFPPFSTRSTL